ncbi:L-lysine N6-monooxygenase [Pseudovibrio axinellae]|uniref:L-lysine N6-monooxygenase n=1 Tax=Pseudovibrio axinellae TaxID=989403 RepID=A0A165UPK9_9HYPH|nr:SidA/IucD/PvdA family monooxygenase [Pseudovibrio axinellae]KZL12664.1 L-lysine N6-monooxygenase [Pseudovibrio axinellae]SEP62408.1 lysine N6-hydroxylase [Pseudovibrio axinellae]
MPQIVKMPERNQHSSAYDLLGLGIGPFNLSVAALAQSIPQMRTAFFDQKQEFKWHHGLMFSGSILQTSFLKDLVTPVEPTSPYSFLAFLVEKKRFYDFLAGGFTGVTRVEFNEYLAWAAGKMSNLQWGRSAQDATLKDDALTVTFDDGRVVSSKNLVIGTGMTPFLPHWSQPHLGENCFHASNYLSQDRCFDNKCVTVIGGGQTGAEIVLDLLTNQQRKPKEVLWISNLPRFSPLEEGGFVDQVFTPGYVSSYQSLPERSQLQEVASQKLASDGLTPSTVDELYAEVYRRKHLSNNECNITLLSGRNVIAMERNGPSYQLTSQSAISEQVEQQQTDIVVLATGARPALPDFMEPLLPRLSMDENGLPELDSSYKLAWDGPKNLQIFGLNLGLSSHGIVDPQMSLMAWRAATILNRVVGSELFDLDEDEQMIKWPSVPQESVLAQVMPA